MGVYDVLDIAPSFVKKQLEAVLDDIKPDAVKIGMVSNDKIINVISETLMKYDIPTIVIDPVMVSTSGCDLISIEAMTALSDKLLPLATLVTPNVPEAEKLSNISITSDENMIEAARIITTKTNSHVLIKGGHFGDDANDLLFYDGQYKWFKHPRIDNPNTHGTGCTLSSAIASNLALDKSLIESVECAKTYITDAIGAQLDIGKGRGPLNHMYQKKS
jgi:hydroxymethylpyrimidine/phosphomethylpyrimidine kinase